MYRIFCICIYLTPKDIEKVKTTDIYRLFFDFADKDTVFIDEFAFIHQNGRSINKNLSLGLIKTDKC